MNLEEFDLYADYLNERGYCGFYDRYDEGDNHRISMSDEDGYKWNVVAQENGLLRYTDRNGQDVSDLTADGAIELFDKWDA